ncbi:tol-pal system protein YbgF [Ramlibacter ginsenosidimutans]|uniref:Cell division coordinator CpoB n=1 Tax=Ramlibacter ginsenosidimutans TaxID=502333 RepID=A0A934WNR1_9BURK|nr:tol-pal system protein YbgF [Ramlibacter ginsenosidimutans]MBK6007850.1 tol-pal system protein YbgF [Ramlibacter ginsenosidimutans]
MNRLHRTALAAAFTAASLFTASAHAALFEDDEARRAILDLRQKVDQQRQATVDELRRASDDNASLRRSLLDLQNQIEALKSEIARLRGSNEQMVRDLSDLQKQQKDVQQAVDDRLRKFEPVKVNVDGRDFTADPAEQAAFEGALGAFRRGDFAGAQTAFADFVRKYPASGYRPTALFWLGNAQYANRDYKGAIANFRALLQQAPDHPRAPEAVLSIANCQIELKDNASARRTLDDLVKAYPQSEAAAAARERLARLR